MYQSGKKAPIRWIISNDPIVVCNWQPQDGRRWSMALPWRAFLSIDMKLRVAPTTWIAKGFGSKGDRLGGDGIISLTVFPIVGSGGDYLGRFSLHPRNRKHCVKHIHACRPADTSNDHARATMEARRIPPTRNQANRPGTSVPRPLRVKCEDRI